jgi:hypothetical protein
MLSLSGGRRTRSERRKGGCASTVEMGAGSAQELSSVDTGIASGNTGAISEVDVGVDIGS